MRDFLTIGSSPCDEDCLQLGSPEYTAQAAKAECQRYIECIRQHCGDEPLGATLRVKAFGHDFGTYHEVVCYFDDELQESVDYAFHVESYAPEQWDGSGAKLFQPLTPTE